MEIFAYRTVAVVHFTELNPKNRLLYQVCDGL